MHVQNFISSNIVELIARTVKASLDGARSAADILARLSEEDRSARLVGDSSEAPTIAQWLTERSNDIDAMLNS